jgi:surface protein
MVGMFWGCELMPSLNISSFNMSRVEATMRMFEDCKALQIIYASSSGWNLDRARRNHNLDNYCILFVDYDYGTEDMYENCPAKVVWR